MCPTSPLWTGVTCSQLCGRKWHWIGGRRLLPGQRSGDLQNKGQGGKQMVALGLCGQQEWVCWLKCLGDLEVTPGDKGILGVSREPLSSWPS